MGAQPGLRLRLRLRLDWGVVVIGEAFSRVSVKDAGAGVGLRCYSPSLRSRVEDRLERDY